MNKEVNSLLFNLGKMHSQLDIIDESQKKLLDDKNKVKLPSTGGVKNKAGQLGKFMTDPFKKLEK